MEYEEVVAALENFIGDESPRMIGNLGNGLYAVSERGLWPDDVDSVSEEQALLCWRLVEKLRCADFPDELRP